MIKKRMIAILIPVALVALGGATWFRMRSTTKSAAPSAQQYVFTKVARGSIESIVTSSGTLQPVSEVSVLPQMSGRALKVHADYNQRVKKGQVLVELDTTMLKLTEREGLAAVSKAKANYDLQALNVQNNKKLYEKGLLSEYDYASSKSSLAAYAAELESAEASLASTRTQLENYALITSPIDGIVLARNVDVGQSVVEGSSSNSSSLFTIAEDLSKMEIEAEVDELDIGSIAVGQAARFTVEALPGTTLSGKVSSIRLVPTETDNVVTYTVIVDAPNGDGKLLPGMTAEVEFIKEKKENILVVPTQAIRFQPAGLSAEEIAKAEFIAGLGDLSAEEKTAAEAKYDEERKAAASAAGAKSGRAAGLAGMVMGGGPGGGPGGRPGSGNNGNATAPAATNGQAAAVVRKPLWYVDENKKLAVVLVEVGASDGKNSEVSGSSQLEGLEIILKAKVE